MIMKFKDIPVIRNKMILDQNGLCLLCEHELDNPSLDHSHTSGMVRGVLCRGCNAFLGKLENSMKINRITEDKLINILKNIPGYRANETDMIHPIHTSKVNLAEKKKEKKNRKINKRTRQKI